MNGDEGIGNDINAFTHTLSIITAAHDIKRSKTREGGMAVVASRSRFFQKVISEATAAEGAAPISPPKEIRPPTSLRSKVSCLFLDLPSAWKS